MHGTALRNATPGVSAVISAQFRIQLPEHLWVSELSREFPTAEFNLLSGYKVGNHALELGETVADPIDPPVQSMRAHPQIRSYELLESEQGRALGKYETPQTDLYEFAELSGLTIEFPIDVRNGWYRFDLTGTREELDELQAVLEASPLRYELQSLVTSAETDALLTDRQREVLSVAVENGYYEIPRETTYEEIAAELGVSAGTVSEHLQKVEATVLSTLV